MKYTVYDFGFFSLQLWVNSRCSLTLVWSWRKKTEFKPVVNLERDRFCLVISAQDALNE